MQINTISCRKFGYSKKNKYQNRIESGIEVDLRMVSSSHLFPGYNLPALPIHNMVPVNNSTPSNQFHIKI